MEHHAHTPELTFEIRSYLKAELAQLYFPTLSPASAMKKLRGWIALNAELSQQLHKGPEGRNDQSYSHRQVALLVKYLQEP